MNHDKETFVQFRKDVTQALRDVCNKYDVEVEAGGITYQDTTFNMKLTVKDRMDPATRFMNDYKNSWLFAYPITRDMYNKAFRGEDGKVYTLVGVKRATKRTAKALIISNSSGQQYVCIPEFIGITQPSQGGKKGNSI